jgi:hypothetical protein
MQSKTKDGTEVASFGWNGQTSAGYRVFFSIEKPKTKK